MRMAENDDSEERWQWHYPRIARLYEMVEINQKNITEAITELKRTTAALPTRVARDVNQELKTSFADAERQLDAAASTAGDRIVQKFEDANAKAVEATAAYQRAAEFAIWHVVAIGLFAVFCGTAAMVVTARSILPDAETVHALRMEEARLRANLEEWRRMEGANVLSHCGPEGRRCVRTNESAKELFGDRGETYRIVYGY
jgi:hypothetical protein